MEAHRARDGGGRIAAKRDAGDAVASIIASRTRELALVGADPEHNWEGSQEPDRISYRVALSRSRRDQPWAEAVDYSAMSNDDNCRESGVN